MNPDTEWKKVARELGAVVVYDVDDGDGYSDRMTEHASDHELDEAFIPAEKAAREILRLRERVDEIKSSISNEMLPKIQAMSNWIGKHWANRDWGCEAEKLHESMGLLDDIAKCVGLDISTGTKVRRLRKSGKEGK